MADTAYGFSGRICCVTRDGRSAIIDLDIEIDGKQRAVISPETIGRIALMESGRLRKGELVIGTAELGSEALRVVTVMRMGAAGQKAQVRE